MTYAESLRLPDTEIVHADPGHLADALAALRADPSVVYAEPDAPGHAYWSEQWALQNVGQFVGPQQGVPGDDIHAPPPGRSAPRAPARPSPSSTPA